MPNTIERNKQQTVIWLLTLLLVLLLAACSQSAEAAEVATVADVSGTVEWQEAAEQEWQPLESGAQLAPGAAIRTGPDGSARLDFPDDSSVHLSADAEMEIKEIRFGEDAERVIHVAQQRGVARHNVHNGDSEPVNYTVSAPNGELSSLAGVFTLDAGEEATAESRLVVSEGLVSGRNAGTPAKIGAGRVAFLRPGEAPESGHFVVYGRGQIRQVGDIWIIGDQHFLVTERTSLDGALGLGDMAYVEGHVGEDGNLIADVIGQAQEDNGGLIVVDDEEIAVDSDNACIHRTKRVADFDGTLITFYDGTTLSLDDVANVEGEVEIDAVLLIQTCTDEEGVTTVRLYVLDDDEQVVLCHVPPGNPENEHSIRVADEAVDAHLGHGDYLGLCDGDDEEDIDNFEPYMDGDQVIVCHLPPGNPENEQSIRIDEPAVDAHLAHGDYLGLCDGDTEDDIVDFDDEGEGVNNVLLCHVPPGNPDNEHEITVGEPAVDAHLAHGDYLGSCTGAGGNGNGPGKSKNKGNRGNGK